MKKGYYLKNITRKEEGNGTGREERFTQSIGVCTY